MILGQVVLQSAAELYLVIILISVLFAFGIGVHASSIGRSGVLWGAIVFLTGLIGAVVYALVVAFGDGGPSETRICHQCRWENDARNRYCGDCGAELDRSRDARPAAENW